MKTSIAGIGFDVGPDHVLTELERRTLGRLGPGGDGDVFCLNVVERAGTVGNVPSIPGHVSSPDGQRVTIAHPTFEAELDPGRGTGCLKRARGPAFPLEITLRTALAARLPAAGGLPLHAAGIVIDGRGVAFFGPSGAGKSTLAGLSPHHVLTDELVAVVGGKQPNLAATGFWGSMASGESLRGSFPLAALVELARGPGLRWERLAPGVAFRRLVHELRVPPGAVLWDTALPVLAGLVHRVPVYRMEWNPSTLSWPRIAERLLGASS